MLSRTPEPVAGELKNTPFAHILVYALDRRLTGALFLDDPTGARHVVRFVSGSPVKVRPGDRYALLGQLLIEAGLITEEALAGALSVKGLLGDALILGGHADHTTVEGVVIEQFFKRMVHLFELPPETRYTYIDGDPELADWGGEPSTADPLALVWAGLREHAHLSSMMDRTLHRLGDASIRVHPAAALERFGFTAGELAAIVRIKEKPRSLADLASVRAAPPDTLRRLIYALLITRHLDFGHGAVPIGSAPSPGSSAPAALSDPTPLADEGPPLPPSVAGEGSPVPSVGQPLARMQLKTVAVRVGAAAPDEPGDGEPRSSPSPSRSKR